MEIKWLPGSDTLFLAAHNDGSLIVYDREKDDAPFIPEDPPDYASVLLHHTAVTASNGHAHAHAHAHGSSASLMGFFGVRKSVRSPNQKTNPLSYWSVAKGPIAAYAFSPDCEHLAVVSEDGCLRVLNFVKEKSVPPHNLPTLFSDAENPQDCWTSTRPTMAARRVCAGRPTGATS